MTVVFAGTAADYAIAPPGGINFNGAFYPGGAIIPNGSFTVYTDAACTVPATGLTSEAGSAIGSTVVARSSGTYVFGAPDGTTVLYVKDSAGLPVAVTPRPDLAYAPIGSGGGGIITGEVA